MSSSEYHPFQYKIGTVSLERLALSKAFLADVGGMRVA